MSNSSNNQTPTVASTNVPAQTAFTTTNYAIYRATFAVMILAMFANAAVLLAILLNRSLRTSPFRVYIINLAGTNLLRVIAQSSPASQVVFPSKNPVIFYADDLCYLLLYTVSVTRFTSLTMHAVIAVNRMWAILQPYSYRIVHSMRFAIISCLITWTYSILTYGVYPLVEAIQRKEYQLNITCREAASNVSPTMLLVDMVGNVTPIVVILVAFPVLVVRMLLQQVARSHRVAEGPPPMRQAVEPVNNQAEKDGVAIERLRGQARAMKKKQLFLLLLTISVAVCYGPLIVFGAFRAFLPRTWYITMVFIITLLSQFQSLLDAFLFVLMFEDLRLVLRSWLNCGRLSSCFSGQQGKVVTP